MLSKKLLALIVCYLYFSLSSFAQIQFEPGYIINNENNKVKCLIRNVDWLDNPSNFQFKLLENDEILEGSVANVKEFSVDGYVKFVRSTVELDTTNSIERSSLSRSRSPQWSTKTLFLKEIVAGSSGLYAYQSASLLAFFYYTPQDSTIKQLVHKMFYASDNVVGENVHYKQQLANELVCGDKLKNSAKYISYSESSLKKYFEEFNLCLGDVIQTDPVVVKDRKSSRSVLAIKVTPGISFGRVQIIFPYRSSTTLDFGMKLSLRGGVEVEYFLPFNKNKWSLFVEPTFQYYKSEFSSGASRAYSLDFKSVEFPVGVRYYAFLKDGGKVFVNAGVRPGFLDVTNSKLEFSSSDLYDVTPSVSFILGTGYSIGMFSAEARLYTNNDLFWEEFALKSRYYRLALIVGIRFVNLKKR